MRGPWRQLWLVDPLDGTREFISRNGEFTVNVALIREHRSVLGVVAAPALGITYYAADGHGAFRRRGNAPPEPIGVRRAAEPLVIVGSRSHRGDSLDEMLGRIGPHELRPMGSALKFCLVAEGTADFYPRLGPTSEWDTAAAQAVLEIAGGAVVRLDGRPLDYNARGHDPESRVPRLRRPQPPLDGSPLTPAGSARHCGSWNCPGRCWHCSPAWWASPGSGT